MRRSLFEVLKTGLKEAIAHAEGRIELRTVTVTRPAPPPGMEPRQIAAVRTRMDMTQVAFADLLNVSPATLRRWERGEGRPTGTALRLLQLAAEKPETLREVAGR